MIYLPTLSIATKPTTRLGDLTPGADPPAAPGVRHSGAMNDALIAFLSAYGPSRVERVARVLRAREGRIRRALDALWLDDLVSVDSTLYRLSARGHARAAVLRENERRFAGLIRTR